MNYFQRYIDFEQDSKYKATKSLVLQRVSKWKKSFKEWLNTEQDSSLISLPFMILEHIFGYLDLTSLACLGATCKALYEALSASSKPWKQLSLQHFGIHSKKPENTWKMTYLEAAQEQRDLWHAMVQNPNLEEDVFLPRNSNWWKMEDCFSNKFGFF